MGMNGNGNRIRGLEAIRTPALIIDRDVIDQNISATLKLLGGDPNRWRPHLKTAKLEFTMRRIRERGVRTAKCATTLELETACRAGFEDVLLSYPLGGAHVENAQRIAAAFPGTAISVLVEDMEMLRRWEGSPVGAFIDLNSGMDRTGMLLHGHEEIIALARAIRSAGLRFGGLHFYDGHAADFAPAEAERRVHDGYHRLLRLVERLAAVGLNPPEVVTAGTPAFPYAVTYHGFAATGVTHRVSPGTVVYNDRRSLTQLPADAGYQPAALVLSQVVSHPGPSRFCLDAGHKAVSADAGDPTCEVVGHPEYTPRHPSEEHLPVDVGPGVELPPRGQLLSLLPSHVCPTVNNFDLAVIVANGEILGVERVSARGRHPPLAEDQLRTI